jgi:hypothetical protein
LQSLSILLLFTHFFREIRRNRRRRVRNSATCVVNE